MPDASAHNVELHRDQRVMGVISRGWMVISICGSLSL